MPILNWLNKEEAVTTAKKCTYRLLEEIPELSYGCEDNENLIIQGDNLEALKSLIPHYAGKIKCIYIDPPYNIGSAFEHYDDNLEHSLWLTLIYPRLELLWELLADNGSIWISCDDRESHYLKVICDELFGRSNFIASNVWQKRYSRENREAIGDVHEYIFVYAKKPQLFKQLRNKVPLTEEQAKVYKNPNNDPKGRWRGIPMTAQAGHATAEQFYPITAPSGKVHYPPEGRCWGLAEATFKKLLAEGRIYFGKKGDSQPNVIRYLSEVEGVTPWTWWPSDEVGHTDESKKEIHAIFGKKNAFDTPKPERLLERILHIATNKGDLVLDSFLGSGTTAAVAHKMGRKFIGVEIGEHAQTHCQSRLKQVVDGQQVGVSDSNNWQGGGGFRFYKLGEAVFDEYGCLNTDIKFPTLASHIWYLETKTPLGNKADTPLLGVHNDTAYYLLYNGILGDRRPAGGNVLTSKVLNNLPDIDKHERIVIYGESSRLGEARLKQASITFKQIPYDVGTL
ncbi:site-specific DNA-methyltransferase [Vibrio parahaemolyticus]|uniref:site-specific DNA-methyltransferase n=1 Tax=Vibrio parahaemolyticus TaxID=670 RepID=UPI001C82AC55|nr:site-specific DNA-methyltransferase [Vibrio parahaemolyticus]ELU8568295.1 site-specific DNA-methyltransferase [Vibrio alginolyticus]MBX5380329.1 site-specific DNA-methyltransferase [Vibrio parahaemolyticus]MBX5398551.1 site-specific DNA-methyltransferase [Vibrio parahaemolyticus]MBX5403198.1 site-specific DNA-methyltransferase [Vibrio parahaemolyticus]MBX5412136.1 site-specific DNA-methyltransferase [Vibrio parahaemolyticus]